jgi:hypothetical protein
MEAKELSEITPDMRVQLRKPFPPEATQQHPTKTYLTTIKAMYVTERLNDVFGVGKWELKTELILATSSDFVVKGKIVSNYWDFQCTAQYGGHTIGEKDKMDLADGYKSAVTDCMGKVASLLEVGIDVFKGTVTPKATNSNFKPKTAQDFEYVTADGRYGFKQVKNKAGEMKYMCVEVSTDQVRKWFEFENEYHAAIEKAKLTK